ncbi:MAG: IS4 family transposase [Planctomycetota bacterium]
MSIPCRSVFAQLRNLIPQGVFDRLVHEHKHEARSKGFPSRHQFLAMLFMQLGQAHSLREIELGLGSNLGPLEQLGLTAAPARSTLAYANEHRSWKLYEALFHEVLATAQKIAQQGQSHGLRFKQKLFSIDATVIDLCAAIFDWAKFRQTKGAVKLHLTLDHQGCLPCYAVITEGRRHEATVARTLEFPCGAMVTMDRGYVDYALFGRWIDQGIDFVTREKKNALWDFVEERPVPENRNIRRDTLIRLSSDKAQKDCPHTLRRVVVWLEDKQQELVLVTNNLKLGATTIAAIYKARWKIELFFKSLKQNFHVKTFVGTSANALKTQLWIALIAMLLVQIVRMQAVIRWSISNLVAFLRLHLMTRVDLWVLVNDPIPAPKPPRADQTPLLALEYG